MMQFFHLYGLCIGLGVLVALKVAAYAQKTLAVSNKLYTAFDLDSILIWITVPAIIGARLYHIIDLWQYYIANPWEILMVWHGGLAIYGAIGGGLLGLLMWKCFYHPKTDLNYVLDVVAFGLPLAQTIGRIGNYFNQELFGLPTTLLWGIYINRLNRPIQFLDESFFHPLFAYEAIANLLWWLLLRHFLKKTKYPGQLFYLYLFGYSLIRFWLDFLRIDPWKIGIFTVAQWVSLVIIGISSFIMVKKQRVC